MRTLRVLVLGVWLAACATAGGMGGNVEGNGDELAGADAASVAGAAVAAKAKAVPVSKSPPKSGVVYVFPSTGAVTLEIRYAQACVRFCEVLQLDNPSLRLPAPQELDENLVTTTQLADYSAVVKARAAVK